MLFSTTTETKSLCIQTLFLFKAGDYFGFSGDLGGKNDLLFFLTVFNLFSIQKVEDYVRSKRFSICHINHAHSNVISWGKHTGFSDGFCLKIYSS